MKERALEIVASRAPAADGTNLLREYVQSRVLRGMQEAGAFVSLAFMGGTALRFLHRIPRFSEDLDFTLERHAERFEIHELAKRLERELTREGYAVTVKVDDSAIVAKAWIGFAGLLAEAGLSPHADQVLRVKLEVDTNPPDGAVLAVTTLNVYGFLRLQHHDLPSLCAGKAAAVLAREYTKGRDLYDLMWYLSRRPSVEPNHELLRNALLQTAPQLADAVSIGWRELVRVRLTEIDWAEARSDVAPFLEQPGDVDLIRADTFEQLLAGDTGF